MMGIQATSAYLGTTYLSEGTRRPLMEEERPSYREHIQVEISCKEDERSYLTSLESSMSISVVSKLSQIPPRLRG